MCHVSEMGERLVRRPFIALVILLTADFVRQEQERGANVAAQHAVPQLAAKASSP